MGQRVNIQYSIDITELEAETQRLIERSESRLNKLLSNFLGDSSALSLETAEAIDSFRIELSEIDYGLNDINKIITGYLSYRSKMLAAEAEPTEAPSEQQDEDLMAGVEEQLRQLGAHAPSIEEAIEEFKKSNAPS